MTIFRPSLPVRRCACAAPSPLLPFLLSFFLSLLLSLPAAAQTPDSAATPQARPVAATFLSFETPQPGTALDTLPPVRRLMPAAERWLDDVPGTFRYALGTLGWPDGVSFYGLPPHLAALTLEGLPFDDLLTGRPRYDLLPLEALNPLRVAATAFGAPAAVHATLRDLPEREPLTEGRYHTSSPEGTQYISVLHVQERMVQWFGREARWHVLFNIAGGRAGGFYPNSDVHRSRLMGRVRYQRPTWALEVRELHTRNRLGAHSGVIPQNDVLDHLYARLTASVARPNDQRQTLRNDLSARLRWRWHPDHAPLDATAFWTRQITRFTADSLYEYSADRLGLVARQVLPLLDLHATAALWLDVNPLTQTRPTLRVMLQDTLMVWNTTMALEAGLQHQRGLTFPTAAAALHRAFGPVQVWAKGTLAGMVPPPVAEQGFSPLVVPLAELRAGRVMRLQAGGKLRSAAFSVAAEGWWQHTSDVPETHAMGTPAALNLPPNDTLAFVYHNAQGAGLTGALGLRSDAARGLYVLLRPTLFLPVTSQARAGAALPRISGEARLGLRALLFQGDLDLDLYLRGRYWSRFRSRTFHPATALFPLPPETSRAFGPSGTLDVHLSAGIRSATVFLSWENVLAQTRLYRGTLLVPAYPFAERLLRFGVYWPIRG